MGRGAKTFIVLGKSVSIECLHSRLVAVRVWTVELEWATQRLRSRWDPQSKSLGHSHVVLTEVLRGKIERSQPSDLLLHLGLVQLPDLETVNSGIENTELGVAEADDGMLPPVFLLQMFDKNVEVYILASVTEDQQR